MPFTLNWNISGDLGPGGMAQDGTAVAEASERISLTVPAGASDTIATAIADMAKLRFLVLAPSRSDGATYQSGAGPAIALDRPVLLSGALARLLGAAPPSLITVTNSGADDLTVELLIYRDT